MSLILHVNSTKFVLLKINENSMMTLMYIVEVFADYS